MALLEFASYQTLLTYRAAWTPLYQFTTPGALDSGECFHPKSAHSHCMAVGGDGDDKWFCLGQTSVALSANSQV